MEDSHRKEIKSIIELEQKQSDAFYNFAIKIHNNHNEYNPMHLFIELVRHYETCLTES
jgi:hypothetical protein